MKRFLMSSAALAALLLCGLSRADSDDIQSDPYGGSVPDPVYEGDYKEPEYEEPEYPEPQYEEPQYQEPRYQEPQYEEPGYDQPSAEELDD